ncbi:uncharacterized protein ocm isoform X2 [Ochlerotatus camptorhynchus]|uniref:uncharacterized protein ocm isoform X2 n=1 Tax=Ochlerotatus camptorhynchus TaxID=644619 RepID=UPI0031DC1E50
MGRKRHVLNRFRIIPAASRARYRRVFRRLSKRYHLPASIDTGRRKLLEKYFCRLMHKQQLAHKLSAHHREQNLVLDKRVGTSPGSLRGATIPEYFRKRILRQQRLAEAIRNKEQREKDDQVVVVDDDDCESLSSDDSDDLVEETEQDEDEEEVESTKQVDIPDPTLLKQEKKEYCSIQEKVQIIISMLKSRAQELEKSNDATKRTVDQKEKLDADAQRSPVKPELPEIDTDLESLKKYYDNSDEEEPELIAKSKDEQDSDVEIVDETDSKPEIVFVDTNALDDDSKDDKPIVGDLKEHILPTKSLKDVSATDLFDPTFSTIKLEPIKTKTSVVDSLFSRFNLTLPTTFPKTATPSSSTADAEEGSTNGRLRDRRKIAVKPRYIEEDDEPKKVRPSKIFDKIHEQLDLDLENTNSNSSTEFYGFDEGDAIKLDKPSVPGLLPTPIVKKSRPNAPFLAPGTIAEDIKIENRDDLFREEGLISFGSLPPRLECPRRPDDMVRPRTVAQKRILLQKKNDVRYLMIDNESKIFNELEKRGKNIDVELNQDRMQELQDQNIPFTRDTWKALAWLRTEKGKYFFQTLRVDNYYVKLTGCRGNHPSKRMGKKQLSAPATVSRKHICHCPECPTNVNIDLSLILPSDEVQIKGEPEETVSVENEEDKKLLRTPSQLPIRTRPGPLSSKFRYDSQLLNRTEDGVYLGPLEIFEMPSVEIEVFPRIDRPLDPTVKPYLKMMLPFRGITEKWARFAVSTLKTPDRKEEDIPAEDRSFSFTMPYLNNQRRILIRRRVMQPSAPKQSAESLDRFEKELKEPLMFRKHLDDPEQAGEVDPVEKECADILSELTDAVAVGMAGDVFISDDPDGDYTKEDKPVERSVVPQDSTKNLENAAKSKRMLREMKRLNATIIETMPEPMASLAEDHKTRCDEQYCARGCICDVFSTKHANVARAHCSKLDCIFGCQCGYDKKRTTTKDLHTDFSEEGLSALTSEDVKYLREKATAKLAKEERDFTPTVIMTTNSTVLVRNTETEMRRNKKKPKKYDDYYNENSVKNLMNGIIPNEEEPREASVERTRTSSVVGNQPLSLQDRIRHTHVVLNKLQDLENIEPWCMIHCLYRCYCHGNATHGKPFKFNEESDIVLPTPAVVPKPDPLLQVYEPRRRRLYSFEKTETITEEVREPFRKRDSSEESYKPWNERRKKKRKTLEDQQPKSPDKKISGESEPSSTRASIEDLQINDGQTCRRAIPVNKNFYRTRNYYRKGRYLKENEEMKRKNPHAEKRLKVLLEKCEKAFFEERKQELEAQARSAMKTHDRQRQISEGDLDGKQRKEPIKEPIFFDIVGTDAKIQQNMLLSPLVDMTKTLIYCGKKKYYVESSAIESGKINLMNIARKFRRTVCILKRVESDPRAKPITFSYKNETIMLKGRKYRMKEPYEQRPNEHVDFDSESDGQESTTSLIQETGNEDDAQKVMLDQVNSDIMHTMQHIREMMRKNSSRLNPPKKGILYLFRWEKFLQAFNEDTVDVWDMTFQNGSELVIITTENNRKNTPSFKNTKSVRFARKSTFETRGVSLLTKMILFQIDNPETNKLSLVLFGTENYWRFCGFIKADCNFLDKGCEVRPTPASHPKLAPKINRYFEAFVASRKKAEEAAAKPTASDGEPSKVLGVPKPIKEEKPTETPLDPVDIPAAIAMVKSNVKLMETKIKDFKNIAIPNVGMRRWFMLNVANDFSDIYIPSWKSCLTYGRIKQAIQLANRYKKTVRLTSIALKADQEDVLPQIYAAPMQGECIFLGPYSYTQNIDLILCQNVDGKMYTREEYERNNHIVRTEHTTGSWLYMKPNVTSTTTTTLVAEPGSVAKPTDVKISSPTPTAAISSPDDDCVVIEDDEESIKPPTPIVVTPVEPQEKPPSEPETPNNNNKNSQLESLIHQLYNDSDSDEDTPSETSSTVSKSTTSTTVTVSSSEQQQSKAALATNQLSLLVEKTISESKQLQIKAPPVANKSAISNRRMSYVPAPTFATPAAPAERKQLQIPHRRLSYIPAATTTIAAHNPRITKLTNLPNVNLNLKRKSTGSTEIEVKPTAGEQNAKKNRVSLPAQTPAVEEVVCLDDDDDDQNEASPSAATKPKPPSCTTVLNSQQAALIASKINLLNPNQKGVVYNPSTGVLRIKRSLMNSLAEGTNVVIPPSSSSKPTSNSALGNNLTSANPQVASTSVTPTAIKAAPSSIVTPSVTRQQLTDKPKPTVSGDGSQLRIEPPKQPTDGVLRSNIPGLGMVPVRWSTTDIIIKVRELSVKQQFVRLANFEAAVVLLNRFIRKNTYTFKPFSLTIGWKFEAKSNALAAEEQLINTINLRCVVTTDGIIDLYKASAIIAFQNTKPNFYEELLLLRLSILCCKKEQYEQEQCHKYFENIFVKATNTIKELASASEALSTQSNFLREQQKERRSYIAKLKGHQGVRMPQPTIQMVSKRVAVPQSILDCVSKPPTAATPSTTVTTTSPTAASQPKESVIVLDDD